MAGFLSLVCAYQKKEWEKREKEKKKKAGFVCFLVIAGCNRLSGFVCLLKLFEVLG